MLAQNDSATYFSGRRVTLTGNPQWQ